MSPTARLGKYRGFGGLGDSIDLSYPVTLVIGRNHSGKSTLLDMLSFLCSSAAGARAPHPHAAGRPDIHVTDEITEDDVRAAFPSNQSGGGLPGNHYKYAEKWIGKTLSWRIDAAKAANEPKADPPFDSFAASQVHTLVTRKKLAIASKVFRRIYPERDITAESDADQKDLEGNGSGATRVIHSVLQKARHDATLIDTKLLSAFNDILNPDIQCRKIVTKQLDDSRWEVYLDEAGKGVVPLSSSGSGVKTVLLVLVQLIVCPEIYGPKLPDTVFGLEELENSLHPALQRRLFKFIRDTAAASGAQMFITTHSPVVIDMFSGDSQAQMVHVVHNGSNSIASRVSSYLQNCKILDDLEVRASDLLQANCVVWVEGPSDRIYVRQWVSEWTGNSLVEGIHYQCVFYGGKLLSHLSGENPDDAPDQLIPLLKINRNSAILIDSDKRSAEDAIRAAKERITAEIKSVGGISWVTAGREVEHYLPPTALAARFPSAAVLASRCGQFEDFEEFLKKVDPAVGRRFPKGKVEFAESMCSHLTKNALQGHLDLSSRLEELAGFIRKCNRL